MPFADVNGMRENADLEEVALLGLCDRMGRLNADAEQEAENIRIFLERCGR